MSETNNTTGESQPDIKFQTPNNGNVLETSSSYSYPNSVTNQHSSPQMHNMGQHHGGTQQQQILQGQGPGTLPPFGHNPSYNVHHFPLQHHHQHQQYGGHFGMPNSNTGPMYGGQQSMCQYPYPQMISNQTQQTPHVPVAPVSNTMHHHPPPSFYAPVPYMHYHPQSVFTQRAPPTFGCTGNCSSVPNQNQAIMGRTRSSTNASNISCQRTSPSSTKKTVAPPSRPSTPPETRDPNALPGGLEVLWRELTPHYQNILMAHDIPDSAKARGYFTVYELVTLKRTLMARMGEGSRGTSTNIPSHPSVAPSPVINSQFLKESKPGSKRKYNTRQSEEKARKRKRDEKKRGSENDYQGSQEVVYTKKDSEDGKTPQEQEEKPEEILGNPDIDTDNDNNESPTKNNQVQDALPPVGNEVVVDGVGGTVKAALLALELEDVLMAPSEQANSTPRSVVADQVCSNSELPNSIAKGFNETETTEAGLGPSNNLSDQQQTYTYRIPVSGVNGGHNQVESSPSRGESYNIVLPSFSGYTNAGSNSVCPSGGVIVGCSSLANSNSDIVSPNALCYPPTRPTLEEQMMSAHSPFRTQILVMKLLQIGSYKIRSFSAEHPNKFKVMFSVQRIKYECLLPVMLDKSDASGVRKTQKHFTLELGFDQISMIDFKEDSLCMRVEGAPSLSLSENQVHDDEEVQSNLTEEDLFFMDHVEKQNLKLVPIHSLHFMNERLVRSLEAHMREHPKFRHFFPQ